MLLRGLAARLSSSAAVCRTTTAATAAPASALTLAAGRRGATSSAATSSADKPARGAAEAGSSSAAGPEGPPASSPKAALDPATGLPLSAPPPQALRDEVEEVLIQQIEELMAADTGAAADPAIKRAAEETLEVITVCESCSQELDEAGQWESLLSSAGLINSPADYAGRGSDAGQAGEGGGSAGRGSAGSA